MSKRGELKERQEAVVREQQPDVQPVDAVPPAPGSVRERVELVRAWLMEGRSTGDIVQVAQHAFQITERMAYHYLARARASVSREALEEGRAFNLGRSQMLRDRLMNRLLRTIEHESLEPGRLVQAITAAVKLLDSRDRSTEQLHVALEDGDAVAAQDRVAASTASLSTEELPALAGDPETLRIASLLLIAQSSAEREAESAELIRPGT